MVASCNNAQVLFGAQDLRLVSNQIQEPDKHEVQLAVKATTLCGSDLHYFHNYANGDIKIRAPLSQGHEAAGEVVAVGAEVKSLKIGDRVAVEAGIACLSCEHCESGRYNVCPELRFRSSAVSFPHLQGTLQERINHPERWCHLLPLTLSYEEGALLEPLSVAIQAARKCSIQSSKCLILGAGAVGLLCAFVARAYGAESVVVTDVVKERLAFALENGFADKILVSNVKRGVDTTENLANSKQFAHDLIAVSPSKIGYDVVFECTGVESCVRTAISACRSSGDVLLVGMGTPIQTLPMSLVGSKEIRLTGVWRYANTYPEALDLFKRLQENTELPDIRKLITHSVQGLSAVPDAFELAGRTKDDNGKLVIKVVVKN